MFVKIDAIGSGDVSRYFDIDSLAQPLFIDDRIIDILRDSQKSDLVIYGHVLISKALFANYYERVKYESINNIRGIYCYIVDLKHNNKIHDNFKKKCLTLLRHESINKILE